MFNLHRYRQLEQARLTQQDSFKKEQTHRRLRVNQRKEMSERSAERRREWLSKNEGNLEGNSYTVLNKGSVILYHPSLHNFRDRCEKPNIYLRQYKTQDQRIQDSRLDYHNAYLELPPYNNKSPHLFPIFLRGDDAAGPKFNFTKYNPPLERIETVPCDTSMLADPKWRNTDKSKWQNNKDFIRVSSSFDRQRTAWKQIVCYSQEPYVDGYDIVGDTSRKRDKSSEISSIKTLSPSQERQLTTITSSLRSYRSIKMLNSLHKGANEGHLKVYKKTSEEALPQLSNRSRRITLNSHEYRNVNSGMVP